MSQQNANRFIALNKNHVQNRCPRTNNDTIKLTKNVKTPENNIVSSAKKLSFRSSFLKKEILNDENDYIDCGSITYLNSPWTVWIHMNNSTEWTESSYINIFTINNMNTFWLFFNNFHRLDKENNHFFIMRDKIKPIWEDNSNRDGGICSIKIDNNHKDIDIGNEIMLCYCLLIINETLICDNYCINGISYSIKHSSIYIKIWTKNKNLLNFIPQNLINKFNTFITSKKNTKLSIKYTDIVPQFILPTQ